MCLRFLSAFTVVFLRYPKFGLVFYTNTLPEPGITGSRPTKSVLEAFPSPNVTSSYIRTS